MHTIINIQIIMIKKIYEIKEIPELEYIGLCPKKYRKLEEDKICLKWAEEDKDWKIENNNLYKDFNF